MIRVVGPVAGVLLLAAASASAQVGRGGDPQSRLQLEAATLESRGDLAGAEAAYRRLLELDPLSSGTMFALERVLRAAGEIDELRPLVVTFLTRSANPQVLELNLLLLVEADSADAMVREADRWLARDPSETVYRSVGIAYQRGFGAERALDVLRRGRSVIGEDDALAVEMGDLLAESGDTDGAIDEWAKAVGDVGLDDVIARVDGLNGDVAGTRARLVDALGESDVPERREAALSAALAFDFGDDAIALARRRADDLEGRSRQVYLEDVARRARASRRARVAAWAFQELGEDTTNPEERRRLDQRSVEVSLQAGDTLLALEAQRRVAASYPGDSDEGRRAQAEVIRMEAAAVPERAPGSWRDFRAAFPNAPELDEVAAAVAMSLQASGNDEGAAAVLDGIDGPRSTLERGYILLARGETQPGREALLAAVGGLSATEATDVIQFSSLLGRLSESGVRALVAAEVEAHRGRPESAARSLASASADLPRGDLPGLLAEAARLAERGGAVDLAAEIRTRLVADHPDAPEMAEASLALARHIGRSGGNVTSAIRLLEELIISRPNSAIVPEARLELERLRSRDS